METRAYSEGQSSSGGTYDQSQDRSLQTAVPMPPLIQHQHFTSPFSNDLTIAKINGAIELLGSIPRFPASIKSGDVAALRNGAIQFLKTVFPVLPDPHKTES